MLWMHALTDVTSQQMQNWAHATVTGDVPLCQCAVMDPAAQAIV